MDVENKSANSSLFETKDISLAAFLILRGFKPIYPLIVRDKYVIFRFESSDALGQARMDYFTQNGLVDASRFNEVFRQLRIRVREIMQNTEGEQL